MAKKDNNVIAGGTPACNKESGCLEVTKGGVTAGR